MGFPWRQIANIGLMIAGAAIPGVGAIEQIAKAIPGMKGKAKQDAVFNLVQSALQAVEGLSGKDLLNDADVAQATRAVIDATVALQNIIAAKQAQHPTDTPTP